MAGIGVATLFKAAGAALSGVTSLIAVQQNAQIAKFNQEVANDNANKSIENAQIAQMEQDNAARAMIGDQLNAITSSGVSATSGSARKNRIAAKEAARLDALRIRQSGELEATNFKNQATSIGLQSKANTISGVSSALGSFLQAGTFVGGAKKAQRQNFFPTPTPRPQVLV